MKSSQRVGFLKVEGVTSAQTLENWEFGLAGYPTSLNLSQTSSLYTRYAVSGFGNPSNMVGQGGEYLFAPDDC